MTSWNLLPESNTFWNFDSWKSFAEHLNFDVALLSNELLVVKPTLQKKNFIYYNWSMLNNLWTRLFEDEIDQNSNQKYNDR
jgi:hypothetical protein